MTNWARWMVLPLIAGTGLLVVAGTGHAAPPRWPATFGQPAVPLGREVPGEKVWQQAIVKSLHCLYRKEWAPALALTVEWLDQRVASYPAKKLDGPCEQPPQGLLRLASRTKQAKAEWSGGNHAIGDQLARALVQVVEPDARACPPPDDREEMTVCAEWTVNLVDTTVSPPAVWEGEWTKGQGQSYKAVWKATGGQALSLPPKQQWIARGVYPIRGGSMAFASDMDWGRFVYRTAGASWNRSPGRISGSWYLERRGGQVQQGGTWTATCLKVVSRLMWKMPRGSLPSVGLERG